MAAYLALSGSAPVRYTGRIRTPIVAIVTTFWPEIDLRHILGETGAI
jgi:hypothetical protein